MTRQQPFATKLRLSRICRWLLALGLVKLGILVALVAGYPLPELSISLWERQGSPAPVAEQKHNESPASTNLAALQNLEAQITPTDKDAISAVSPTDAAASSAPVATVAAVTPKADNAPEPQGSAAARAAAQNAPRRTGDDTPGAASSVAPLPGVVASTPQAAPAQDAVPTPPSSSTVLAMASPASPAVVEDSSWWGNILQLKTLPFPRLGIDQAAHAATLDAPPPPALPGRAAENSPFVPPAQAIPSGQNPDGSPIPPRSTTARPLPAGSAGPQLNTSQGPLPSALVPNDRPPVPRVDAYVPPEDPNRKQQELARREQEVLVLKQQMEQRLEELKAAERRVQGMLEEAKEVEKKKTSSLTAMYVNMKPKQAAKAIESMDERIAVKILSQMSPKQSGEILTYTDPKKTAKLTEIISRMRLGQ